MASKTAPATALKAAPARMHARDFGVSSFKFNRWSAELGAGQTLEQALEPQFWANIADAIMGHDKSKPRGRGDIIEVRQIETGLYAELLVSEVGPGFVRVSRIRDFVPDVAELPKDSPFATRWNAGDKVHEVIRKADKQLMQGGFQSKGSAIAWIVEHLARVAA